MMNNSLKLNNTHHYIKVDWLFIVLFWISCTNSILGCLFYISLIYYWKFGVTGCIKALIFLTFRGLLSSAVAVAPAFQIVRWGIMLCTAILILHYSKVEVKNRIKYKSVMLSILIFSITIAFGSLYNSSYPVTALFKTFSFTIVYIAILKGISATIGSYDWKSFLMKIYLMLFGISVLTIPFSRFRIVNSDFQGIFNHVNIFGIIGVTFIAILLSSSLMKIHQNITIIIISIVLIMIYLSASRTGLLSAVAVIGVYILFHVKNGWSKMLIVLVSIFLVYFCLPSHLQNLITESINEFIYKNNATEIWSSRAMIIEDCKRRFQMEPIFGTGFMVPFVNGIRDYSLNFGLLVEPGNMLWAVLGDCGILGAILFAIHIVVLIINGRLKDIYMIVSVFLVCMGEMVFFSVNNMSILLYVLMAIFLFEDGEKESRKI